MLIAVTGMNRGDEGKGRIIDNATITLKCHPSGDIAACTVIRRFR